jgi:hypothetical protein
MILLEIKNLNLRLTLIRNMQMAGVLFFYLFFCHAVVIGTANSQVIFGMSLLGLLISLGLSFWESVFQ